MVFWASLCTKRSYKVFLLTIIMFKHANVGKHIEYMDQKLSKNMPIVKLYPRMKCLRVFFSFFYLWMKFHPCLFVRVHPGMKFHLDKSV